jgi:hypothetical protein
MTVGDSICRLSPPPSSEHPKRGNLRVFTNPIAWDGNSIRSVRTKAFPSLMPSKFMT